MINPCPCPCPSMGNRFLHLINDYHFLSLWHLKIWGQSYKTFYTLGPIYKLVLKLDNMLWLSKYLVRMLGHYTLMYYQSNFFDRGTISNLGTLFYTSPKLKLLYRIGPCRFSELLNFDRSFSFPPVKIGFCGFNKC